MDLELDLLRHLEIKARELIPVVEKQTIEKILACEDLDISYVQPHYRQVLATAEEVMERLK